ncbi:hypothetical protein BDP27DRAFT_1422767 [Rhodocollybia butyracea]|uniref:F-box domain-containing protein n=1 Tax=Rhodocollybia butyracea TaxID=206335 RepID=A0A9P5U5B3_9AGAR|nr:hypothetical protein BDP27DRAFT_1422767 [Rhodocollybia butyracea]
MSQIVTPTSQPRSSTFYCSQARRSQSAQDLKAASGDIEMEDTPTDSRGSKCTMRDNDDVQEEEDDVEQRPKKQSRKASAPKLKHTNLKHDNKSLGSSATAAKTMIECQSICNQNFRYPFTDTSPFHEIFCYLEPDDLLRLARTTKDLRCILMTKSSASIWRAARENVKGLPIRPDDLNEPQYAHLCYESYCDASVSKHHIRLIASNTACLDCIAKMPLYNGVGTGAADQEYATYLHNDYRDGDILPKEKVDLYLAPPSIERLFIGDTQTARQFKVEYDALTTPEDRTNWIQSKSQERREIAIHASLCQKGMVIRLGEIGWCEEAEILLDGWPGIFIRHKAVNQTKKLTEHDTLTFRYHPLSFLNPLSIQDWNSIKDELVQFLENHKTSRVGRTVYAKFQERYDRIGQEYTKVLARSDLRVPFPTSGDILTKKVFKDLIWDTPADEYLRKGFLASQLSEHLPSILSE